MKKNLLSLLLIFYVGVQIPLRAQQMLGISTGNYAGTHGVYLNPSYAADTRHGFYLNMFSFDGYVSNNYATWAGPGSLASYIIKGNEMKEDYLSENLNGKTKMINAGIDLRGSSFLLKMNAKSGLAITSRVRGSLQMFNISENIAKMIRTGIDNPEIINQMNEGNSFTFNSNLFSEIGLTYGRTVWEQDAHFLKAGITVKKLSGYYSAYAVNDGLNFQVSEDMIKGYYLDIQNIGIRYGASSTSFDLDSFDGLGGNKTGSGWGLDLGATYEHRKNIDDYKYTMNGEEKLDNRKNKYDYKIGISIIDIGGIKYANPEARSYDIKRTNVVLSEDDFSDLEENMIETFGRVLDVKDSEKKNSLKAGLPTAFNANLDYKLTNKVYANLNWIHSLRGKEVIGMRQFSSVSITPRVEMKWLELAFPISLMDNYNNLAFGAAVKMGAFYVGSDNLAGVTGLGKVYGANVYAGLSIPIFKGKKKDKDNDGVSNKLDKCKKIAGTWEKEGCPEEAETLERSTIN